MMNISIKYGLTSWSSDLLLFYAKLFIKPSLVVSWKTDNLPVKVKHWGKFQFFFFFCILSIYYHSIKFIFYL